MTPAAALAMIRRAATTHQLEFPAHAYQRMEQRGMTFEDVEHACLSASEAVLQAHERWRLEGQDPDGDDLTVIAVIEAGVIIVTVF